nr:MAG TPA: hypothetical protein [Caudoviricetes sp.]
MGRLWAYLSAANVRYGAAESAIHPAQMCGNGRTNATRGAHGKKRKRR